MSSKKGQKQAGQNMKSTVGGKRQGLGGKDRSQSPPSMTEKTAKFNEKYVKIQIKDRQGEVYEMPSL